MEIVTKTVSSMRCCKSVHASRRLRWAILAWMLGAAIAARADARADLTTLRVERTDEGLFLSAQVRFDLTSAVQDALLKGIRWKIANPSELESGGRQMLNFRFRLDSTQLPRTFQIGAVGQSDWHLSVERRIDLTQEASR